MSEPSIYTTTLGASEGAILLCLSRTELEITAHAHWLSAEFFMHRDQVAPAQVSFRLAVELALMADLDERAAQWRDAFDDWITTLTS